jgi:hypothetical protein
MSQLFNHDTGQWVNVNDSEVDDLVRSGRYTFAKGIDVPVMAPDGSMGTVKSEDAYEGFQRGLRWQTVDDLSASAARADKKIIEEKFDQDILAGGAGFLRQYVPGADYGMQLAADAYGAVTGQEGLGDTVKEGLGHLRDVNPYSTLIGEVTGAIASPLGKIAAAKALKLGNKAGDALAGGAFAGRAGKIVQNLESKALGSAFEGAYFGLADGLSEAALGDPNDVVENILASTGTGLLFGGLAGGILGVGAEAAPYLKKGISGAVDWGSDLTDKVLQKSASTALRPVLSPKVEKDVFDAARGMIPDKEMRHTLFAEGGIDAVRKVADDLERIEKEYFRQTQRTQADVEKFIKSQSTDAAEMLADDFAAGAGNATMALKASYGRYDAAESAFQARLADTAETGVIIDDVMKRTQPFLYTLYKSKGHSGKTLAKEVDGLITAELAAAGVPQELLRKANTGKAGLFKYVDEGTEVQLVRDIRERLRNTKGLSGSMKESAKKLDEQLSEFLYEHPTFGTELKQLDDHYKLFADTRKFITGKADGRFAKNTVVQRMVYDPEYAAKFDEVLSNFEQFAPEFAALKSAGKDLVQRDSALKVLQRKIRETTRRGATADELDEFVRVFDPPTNMLDKLDDIRKAQTLMAEQGVGPVSKYIAILKATGKPVAKELEDMVKFESQFAAIEKILPKSARVQDYIMGAVDGLRRRGANIALRSVLGGVAGGAISQDLGIGMGAGALAGATASPYRVIKTLTSLERKFNKGYKAVEKASHRIIDGLTSEKFRKPFVVANAVSYTSENKSLEEKRKEFRKQAEYLKNMGEPQFAVREIERRITGIEDAPGIQAAASAQLTKVADFLQSKMPQDPMAGETALFNQPYWEPSDYELAKFQRYVDAAENPITVLEHMAAGSVTPEEIETLQTLYPQMYDRLQKQVLNAIMKPDVVMSYDQRLMLAAIFDTPVDPTLQPHMMGALQQTFAQRKQAPQQGAQPQAPRSIRIDLNPQATQTEVSRVTYE